MHESEQKMSPEEELAQIVRERAAKEEQRAGARKAAILATKLAAERRGLEEDETWAKLESEHGVGNLRRINTPHGMVIVKAAPQIAHRRFADEMARAESANPKIRKGMTLSDAGENFAALCRVYPDKASFEALCEKVGNLVGVCANQAYEIGQAEAQEDEGK